MSKFITPGTMPTPYQDELLTILMEECAEITQRASKSKRFGIDEIQPGQSLDNTDRLSLEVGDLLAVIERCVKSGIVNLEVVSDQHDVKMAKLDKYMQNHNPDGDDTE